MAALTVSRHGGLPYGEILEQLSAFTIRKFIESPIGKGLWMMVAREPHDILKRSLGSIRAAMTHGQRRYEELGPNGARIVFQGELMGPSWTRGIFQSGLQVLSQKPVSLSIENLREPGLDFTLRFSW